MAAFVRVCIVIVVALLAGCSRSHYRHRADVDAYSLIHEKAGHTPWDVPYDYDVVPMVGSRLHDPTPLDDPLLPKPSPQLYAYDLPQLSPRDPERFKQRLRSNTDNVAQVEVEDPSLRAVEYSESDFATSEMLHPPTVYIEPIDQADDGEANESVQFASLQQEDLPPGPNNRPEGELPIPNEVVEAGPQDDEVTLAAVPASAWEEVPESCKLRMFEFESIREEFQRTFNREPSSLSGDSAQALALEDIVELALLNSRDYQTQKETLYRTALRLSLQRFDYDLKFSTNGNRIATNYSHARDGGITVNRLRVPSGYQVDKMLATGGTLLMRFANNLVLTFNGTNGFATDISSDIVLDIEQTLLQIDVQFEPLTQAERDLVYAARDFARDRKTLYTSLASRYYTLIRTYRQVEIDSQNYLTLARAFDQAKAEYRNNQEPLFQVDQVEQRMLSGRSTLIGTCNGLEQALDNLKLQIGLPTETLVNIDLTELEQLTRQDELAVRRELVRRVYKRLDDERNAAEPKLVVMRMSTIDLVDRMLAAFEILEQLGEEPPSIDGLKELQARYAVDLARSEANDQRDDLENELANARRDVVAIFGRTIDLTERLLILIDQQIKFAELRGHSNEAVADMRGTLIALQTEHKRLENEDDLLVARISKETQENDDQDPQLLVEWQRLVDEVTELRSSCEEFVELLDDLTQLQQPSDDPKVELNNTIKTVNELLVQIDQLLTDIGGGLAPIEVEVDDAMMTALVLRLDLMNERGALADDWRQIKLAADDLKSVLNLRATQTVRSPGDNPFDFTFDESLTQLNATLDLPLNRRAQRNTFRQSLINYQAAIRQLMQLEDNIKLEVRNELRALALDQEQYQVDVASAGLAYERVVSTQLEQRLGIGGVTARDFLEAQDAYTSALSSVARRHINYIVNRMELFLNTELLEVNELGLWDALYDESVQPTPYYQLPPHAYPFYGELPCGLHFSPEIRRMEYVPQGTSMFHRAPTEAELESQRETIESVDQAIDY